MKCELIYQYEFKTDEELNEEIEDYVFEWDNYKSLIRITKGKPLLKLDIQPDNNVTI